ncbi:MAG TPA: apolipoprotein N-acyltransferase, partial [Thermoanaerobaculia bacterium]|nr:apolipoprotein N-acyltransferase [Thermoanaerobaculia bacterium]
DDVRLRLDLQSLATGGGCSVLFNTAVTEGERVFNSVLLVSPAIGAEASLEPWASGLRGGTEELRVQRADKRHLVPFGEYVPLRSLFPFIGKIARMVGDFSPADGIRLLDWRGERMGAAVCYEVVFPGETSALVHEGATLLLTVTNDAWYGDTAAPRQHFRAARFRAAENRRWLLRAAITGISAVVRPDGSIAAVAEVGEIETLVGGVVGRSDRSPLERAPWLLPALAIALAAVALLRSVRPSGQR